MNLENLNLDLEKVYEAIRKGVADGVLNIAEHPIFGDSFVDALSDNKKPEWIPIDERLPPQDTVVLVTFYDDRPKVNMKHVQQMYRLDRLWFDPKDGEKINMRYGFITHWMPNPDPAN